MNKIAKKLEFNSVIYDYSQSKNNVLTYVKQPFLKYNDLEECGGVLVVKYRPYMKSEKDKYVVLHIINVRNDGFIQQFKISGQNKIPTIVDDYNS